MKKALLTTAILLASMITFGQAHINNNEGMGSVRTKINLLIDRHDTTRAVQDSIIGGLKSIELLTDTLTSATKYVVVDSMLKVPYVSATQTIIGDSANGDYLSVGAQGQFLLVGEASQWEDVRCEPVARTTGTNAPDFEQYMTNGGGSRGVYLYSFTDAAAGSEKELCFNLQMPHAWVGDSVTIHVHYIVPVALGGVGVPRFALEYTWAEPGALFPNTQILYINTNVQGVTTLAAFTHYIAEFAVIPASSTTDGLSTTMMCRLFRDSGNVGDTYNGNKVGIMYIDAHIKVNSLGSNLEYTK